ncbi:MAG TPA: MmgE/PrpD family protein [Burkholderiales bacterium]|nr:MmgE/PrpD family protein [Burkholderiales bacterium]
MDTTHRLARFIVSSRYEDIPADVRHEASRAFLNALGCAIGSARHETVERALAAVQPFSGTPQATLWGRSERLDAINAALMNGISTHVLDFDDTHQRAVHPTAPVLPALLAYSEWRPVSGRELVHAFVLGVEAEIRIGLSVFPEHYDIGWHITGTAGTFGAAAAVGKLIGLDEQRMTWTLGIAATQAAGLREMFGSMCKSLHPGNAARNGLTAALLAAQGFTSSERAIEAPRGFANVASTKFEPGVIIEGLGQSYELSRNMYKPYACGLVVHAAIDACIQLKREHALEPAMIERVELTVGPLVPELCGKRDPRDGLEGKFSVYHAAAAALTYGAAGEAQFADDVVRNPAVIALRDRVSAAADPAMRKLEARATIRLRDGTVLESHVEHALGTVERPMSDRDLEDKFRGLTEDVLSAAQSAKIIELCWGVESLNDAGELSRATAVS